MRIKGANEPDFRPAGRPLSWGVELGAWGERVVASGQWIWRREPAAMGKRRIEAD